MLETSTMDDLQYILFPKKHMSLLRTHTFFHQRANLTRYRAMASNFLFLPVEFYIKTSPENVFWPIFCLLLLNIQPLGGWLIMSVNTTTQSGRCCNFGASITHPIPLLIHKLIISLINSNRLKGEFCDLHFKPILCLIAYQSVLISSYWFTSEF